MTNQSALRWLVPLIAILAAIAAAVGLFSTNGTGPFLFTTLHGEIIEIYGRGLYQYDTPLIAVGYRVGDAFTLFVGSPLLLVSLWRYQHDALRGKIGLTGLLDGEAMFIKPEHFDELHNRGGGQHRLRVNEDKWKPLGIGDTEEM